MTSLANPRITAVVVSYHPALDVLERLLRSVAAQVTHVLLVDNGSDTDLVAWNDRLVVKFSAVLPLGDNKGIATAQNIGIEWARQQGAEHVLLMDQDSLPADDMVDKLILALASRPMAAAVGPRYVDERQNNPPPFLNVRGLRLERCGCPSDASVVPVAYLIASGSLIPMRVLDEVGEMREDFFIDYVDIEWGLRAGHHGYQSYGVCAAHMRHSLGDNPIIFFGRNIPLHSPLRHYYHFRNAVFLYRSSWVRANWKLVDGWRLVLKYVFYSLFATPRRRHLKMMTLGVWHGLTSRGGRYG